MLLIPLGKQLGVGSNSFPLFRLLPVYFCVSKWVPAKIQTFFGLAEAFTNRVYIGPNNFNQLKCAKKAVPFCKPIFSSQDMPLSTEQVHSVWNEIVPGCPVAVVVARWWLFVGGHFEVAYDG